MVSVFGIYSPTGLDQSIEPSCGSHQFGSLRNQCLPRGRPSRCLMGKLHTWPPHCWSPCPTSSPFLVSPQYFLLTAGSACPLILYPHWQASSVSLYRSLLACGGPGVPCPGALSVGIMESAFHHVPLFVPSIIHSPWVPPRSQPLLFRVLMPMVPSRQMWLLSHPTFWTPKSCFRLLPILPGPMPLSSPYRPSGTGCVSGFPCCTS